MSSRTLPLVHTFAVVVTLASGAAAQFTPRPPPAPQSSSATAAKPAAVEAQRNKSLSSLAAEEALREKFEQRSREKLHPGGALEIVGREQDDNQFRTRTPALVNAERETVYVDPQELRERKLAMYGERREFHEPLARAVVDEDGFATRAPAGARTEAAAPTSPRSAKWPWLVAGVLAAAVVTFVPRGAFRLALRKPAGQA